MQLTQILSIAAFLLPSVIALPASLENRDSCVDTCGSTCYWSSDISAAQDKGYQLYQSGETLGEDEYPHKYNDYEGFSFPVDGPYYEFPILSSYEVYSGGSPGPDRVVFNGNNQLAGLITHTGASGDDFVQCQSD